MNQNSTNLFVINYNYCGYTYYTRRGNNQYYFHVVQSPLNGNCDCLSQQIFHTKCL